MASPFVHLPEDATRLVASLLEYVDVQALRGVCRATACDQLLWSARSSSLVLPPTDNTRARRLIRSLDARRFASFHWIRVATPWHLDVLRADPHVCGQIESVRVCDRSVAHDDDQDDAIQLLSEKLQWLPNLYRLDVSDTALVDVSAISKMTQLRELNLSGTMVQDISALESLTCMQVLILERCAVTDVSCLRSMLELRVLKVDNQSSIRDRVFIPSLYAHTRLHTLDITSCSIESASDLLGAAASLEVLKLTDVTTRHGDVVAELDEHALSTNGSQLLAQFTNLKTVRILHTPAMGNDLVTSLAKVTSLRSIQHYIDSGLHKLVPLVNLEELDDLVLRAGEPHHTPHELQEFRALLQFPHLRKINAIQNPSTLWPWPAYFTHEQRETSMREARAFTDAVVQLQQLTSLSYNGFLDSELVLPKLSHLEHLSLGRCAPTITSFDWICSFQRLRSLAIHTNTSRCDLRAVASLTNLQELKLHDACWRCDHHSAFEFLTPLVKLKKLELTGRHIHDLQSLCGMQWLQTLRICSTETDRETANVDALRGLKSLQELDIAETTIYDLSPLLDLQALRCVKIPRKADCSTLAESGGADYATLLRVLHPDRNCLWKCEHRDAFDAYERELMKEEEEEGRGGGPTV